MNATAQSNGHSDTLAAAMAYHDAGFSIVPIKRDGSKAPTMGWTDLQSTLPPRNRVADWFKPKEPPGVAIIAGRVSRGSEAIDFDELADEIFPEWKSLVELESPGLVDRLTIIKSPRGYHVWYRVADFSVPGNEKLAVDPSRPGKKQTLIETRGEGGYCIVPGTPGCCHPSGKTYQHLAGPKLSRIATITEAERDILIRCARSFDKAPEAESHERQSSTSDKLTPIDDFNRRGPAIAQQISEAGWTEVARHRWRRPDKTDPGWSATSHCTAKSDGRELLCVFSSNAQPFPGPGGGKLCSRHDRFDVYCLLNHAGDTKAAVRTLGLAGYGEQKARVTFGENVKYQNDEGDGHGDAWEGEPSPSSPVDEPPHNAPPRDPLTIYTFGELKRQFPNMRPPLIEGILRQGETMNIIAASKVGKSWLSYGMAVAVATGRKWLDLYDTVKGDVLLLDNELHPETIANRIPRVCSIYGIPLEEVENRIHVLPLRGRLRSLPELEAELLDLGADRFKLIIVDASYRAMPQGMDENSNLSMTQIYNLIDRLADKLGVSFVIIHHASKGSQADKAVTDVGSGAGAMSRAADTHLVLRPHKNPNTVVLEAAVRSWPPVFPVCLKWTFPIWQPDRELDPTELHNPRAKKKTDDTEAKEAKKAAQQAAQDTADELKLLEAVDKAAKSKTPVSKTAIRELAKLSSATLTRTMDRLADTLEYIPCEFVVGSGAKKPGETIRRKNQTDQTDQADLFDDSKPSPLDQDQTDSPPYVVGGEGSLLGRLVGVAEEVKASPLGPCDEGEEKADAETGDSGGVFVV